MNIWRLKTHHIDADSAFEWTRKHERIAVGFGEIGDLRRLKFSSANDLKAVIKEQYPQWRSVSSGSRSLWNLFHEMQRDDLVLLSARKARVAVVRVLDDYVFDDGNRSTDDYFHQRRVEFTNLDPEKVWRDAGAAFAHGEGIYQTLIRVGSQ